MSLEVERDQGVGPLVAGARVRRLHEAVVRHDLRVEDGGLLGGARAPGVRHVDRVQTKLLRVAPGQGAGGGGVRREVEGRRRSRARSMRRRRRRSRTGAGAGGGVRREVDGRRRSGTGARHPPRPLEVV